MFRFLTYALPLLVLLLALFGFVVELLDLEPSSATVIRLALLEPPTVPATIVLSTWLMEACGLLALFLLAQGRCGTWWMDGLVAGWLAWVFRGPLLVLTIVVAVRQPQEPWWELTFAWWWLYSICGLSLALLAKRSGLAASLETEASASAMAIAEAPSPEPLHEEIDDQTFSSGGPGEEDGVAEDEGSEEEDREIEDLAAEGCAAEDPAAQPLDEPEAALTADDDGVWTLREALESSAESLDSNEPPETAKTDDPSGDAGKPTSSSSGG